MVPDPVHQIVTSRVMGSCDRGPASRRTGALFLGHSEGEHAVFKTRVQGGVVEGMAESQAQSIIALGIFEMESLPIHAHHMRFAGGDDEIGSTDFDGDAGSIHTWHVNDEFHGIGLFPAVIARLAVFRIEIPDGSAVRPDSVGLDDRVHGKMENDKDSRNPLGVMTAGLQRVAKQGSVKRSRLGLRARADQMFIPMNGDRTHLTAAMHGDGLRKRSAGRAAVMLISVGHGNVGNMHTFPV